ncbi:MAG: hypothetical protein WBC40_11760 [Halobacteriota archaeon]
MKMVYGPVPSRRLGRSLGVNPIPFKTCDYSCVYCQLGRTTHITTQRKDFFPPEELLNEIKSVIEVESSHSEIDFVTLLVKGLNDSEEELKAIKSRLEHIEPDRTYINVPIRPPAEPWAVPPDKDAIALAHAILGDATVVDITAEETGDFSTDGFTNPEEAILAIIRRHPMREEQVIETLKKFKLNEEDIHDSLKRLAEK